MKARGVFGFNKIQQKLRSAMKRLSLLKRAGRDLRLARRFDVIDQCHHRIHGAISDFKCRLLDVLDALPEVLL